MKASIQPGWHVYSKVQPRSAVAEPLKVVFNKNQKVALDGKTIELGKLEKTVDKSTKIAAHQYSNSLTVSQMVKLTKPGATTISGILTYQTCNDQRCLPSEDVEFSVPLHEHRLVYVIQIIGTQLECAIPFQ